MLYLTLEQPVRKILRNKIFNRPYSNWMRRTSSFCLNLAQVWRILSTGGCCHTSLHPTLCRPAHTPSSALIQVQYDKLPLTWLP